jgi:hypothetical protein
MIIIAAFVMVTAMGCKNDLDIPDPNTPTTDNFWKTSTDAQMGVNAIYSTFHRVGLSRWFYFMTIVRSDVAQSKSPNHTIVNVCDQFNIVNYGDTHTQSIWQDLYIGINRANQVLDNVPGIKMDGQVKKQLLGEASFLRGLFYYHLAVLCGNVPIPLHTSKISDYPATKPQDSVFAQVEKDLSAAADALPESYDASMTGRATKGAAYAMLGKAYLQQHKYKEAAQAFAWVVDGPGKNLYSLVKSYRDNFLEATENNSESIFEIQNLSNPINNHDNDLAAGGDRLNTGSSIPPFFSPRPIGFTDGQALRWVVWAFLKEKTITNTRDPRLAATFLYDSTDERGPDYTMVFGRTWTSLKYSDDASAVPNNYDVCFRKLLDDAAQNGENFRSANNHRQVRLGGVLLLYAEALNGMGQTAQAYPYVDRVRERVGLAPLSLVKPGLSQQDFLTQLKHERLLETCGEGHRWEDLERWGELSTAVASRDPAFVHFVKGRDELLPIPQLDIDINPNMQQNPGY